MAFSFQGAYKSSVATVKFIFTKLFTIAILFIIFYFIWSFFSRLEDHNKFISVYQDVQGLSRGSPVRLGGVQVGKVLKIAPIANSNTVAVESIIFKSDLDIDTTNIATRIVQNVERGGGKVLEITHYKTGNNLNSTGDAPYFMKYASRIALDGLQLTKDFAVNTVAAISQKDDMEYKEELRNNLDSSIVTIENGLVADEMNTNVENINHKIEMVERYKEQHPEYTRDKLADQLQALKNTLSSFSPVSKVYEQE
jgi:hypothetical protein